MNVPNDPINNDRALQKSTSSALAQVIDSELFIRQSFAENAKIGFELLFRRYYGVLHSQATRIVYSCDLADDIVSDVFLAFWQNQVYERIETSFRAYLMASVRHAAFAYLRRDLTNRKVSLEQAETLVSELPGAEQLLAYDELSLKIDAAIRDLPTQCQRVFLLSRTENKNNAQIADQLQISIRTVEVHLYRAIRSIKRIVFTT